MIRNKANRSRATLGLPRRLIIGFAALILVSLVAGLLVVSALMRARLHDAVDTGMKQQAQVLQGLLEREEISLAGDTVMASDLRGVGEAIESRDTAQLKRLLIPVMLSNALTSVYVIYEDGPAILLMGEAIAAEERVAHSRLAERGRAFLSSSGMLEFDGTLWLGAVAAHRRVDGKTDALLLFGKRADSDYIQNLSELVGLPIAFEWGKGVAYSLDPAPAELSLDQLRAFRTDSAEYREGSFAFRELSIGPSPYRMLAFEFSSRNGRPLVGYLFQPMSQLYAAMSIAVVEIIGGGLLLALMAVAFAILYVRRTTQPLAHLERAAQVIAQGNLDTPILIDGRETMGQLPQVFENMRVRLRDMVAKQEDWNRELEGQVRIKTEEMKQLCEMRDRLVGRMITTQEEERRRIARELHDETSQALTGLQVHLATAEMDLTGEAKEWIAGAKQRTLGILREVNRVVLDLRPTLLDDYGLESALSWYASTHLTNAGTTAEFIPDGVETRLSPMVETVLFRIGQEAISNASKYAGAKNVRISLAVEKDANPPSVVLKVEDDGCGFDVKAAAGWNDGRPRFGLLGMQERVELVGGDLEIRSAPGFGTQVIARVPLSIATQENNNP